MTGLRCTGWERYRRSSLPLLVALRLALGLVLAVSEGLAVLRLLLGRAVVVIRLAIILVRAGRSLARPCDLVRLVDARLVDVRLLGLGDRSASLGGLRARFRPATVRARRPRLIRRLGRGSRPGAVVPVERRRGHARDLGRGRGRDGPGTSLLRRWEEKDRSDADEGKRGRDGEQADDGDHDPCQASSHFLTPLPLRHPGCRNLNRSGGFPVFTPCRPGLAGSVGA
jgi:hypothetical protein